MNDTLTLTGVVATDPQTRTTSGGVGMTTFRLASSQRRFDKATQQWVDADTNWYSVTAFRQLGANADRSLAKGDRVIVVGKVRIRRWEQAERSGSSIDLEAETIGHDLSWGTAVYTRARSQGSQQARAAEETFPETVADPLAGPPQERDQEALPVPF